MPEQIVSFAQTLSVWFLPVVLAITLHEAAHAWVAERFGDDTARRHGRVTFNPARHVDPFGTVLLPGMLLLASKLFGGPALVFGWAKPVPVAFHRLRKPKRDMIWVALAGPGINIVLALAAGLVMQLLWPYTTMPASLWVWHNLENAMLANVLIACINMLPLPPLDGGRVMVGILPLKLAIRYARIEPFGLLILLAFAFLVPLGLSQIGIDFHPLADVVWPVFTTVHGAVLLLTGW